MSALVVLGILVAFALLAPRYGADTRWTGSGARADRPSRGKRYRHSWDAAIAEKVDRESFDRVR